MCLLSMLLEFSIPHVPRVDLHNWTFLLMSLYCFAIQQEVYKKAPVVSRLGLLIPVKEKQLTNEAGNLKTLVTITKKYG